ncbi:calcium:proton antiporter [Polluticaenibacter yanchengensis]|uniref:Ionic transporter y4hA n=1 Tax=Polluticaenibacter yanchengensis TaxID=3014562 RepID=A0ABT4UMJ2_9BACT|nr:ionic transporter y4hA [Chitinophagaceae bacterium LY-5]
MSDNKLKQMIGIDLPLKTVLLPVLGLLILLVTGTFVDTDWYSAILSVVLISVVLSAVFHAEVVAHKVGEPYGTLILALAVTIIEVSLIVSIMFTEAGAGPSTLARDTVFAAIMIILTGMIGICLLVGGYKYKEQIFAKKGVSAALVALIAIATLALVLPNYTTSSTEGSYTNSQLIFVAIVSLILYFGFVSVQTLTHRDYFLPASEDVVNDSNAINEDDEPHAAPPNVKTAISSLVLLLLALVSVVALSKKLAPKIEAKIEAAGLPQSLVGIIVAGVILLPEGIAAYKAARKNRLQTSLNLALGSALASIGLTIPAVAIVCITTNSTVTLGIDEKSTILLLLSLLTIIISFSSGKTNILYGIVLLVIFATYLFTTIVP